MFCVIQEVQTKKPDKDGYPKELISKYMKMSISGRDCSHYYYSYSEERFERPIKSSYRISIHSSFRKNGKPQKRQFVICTVKYYDLATDYFTLYDWGDSRIQAAAHELQVSPADIYSLIDAKLEPLKDRIISAFHQTEEYKTHEEHERITTIYAAKKVQFAEQYEIDASEYDCVYDVFGNLRNPEYLKRSRMIINSGKSVRGKDVVTRKRHTVTTADIIPEPEAVVMVFRFMVTTPKERKLC